ncbi:MAG TPA: chemotaxis protein CheB [Methylophilaceae bacterium]|nr:chemotaxis protein CheB [Methylophilaceae bacterium]
MAKNANSVSANGDSGEAESSPALTATHPDHTAGSQRIFPIIALGASAGGLEAFTAFLGNFPANSGVGIVIIQHLDPTQKTMLSELLQRVTTMPIVEVRNNMQVEKDCVYVIPPNKDLSILHGVLYLLEPSAPRGQRLPIDFFFRALADDRQGYAVGVIMSGMGSDGALGLRAIKENTGLNVVQAPDSAKFDSMPRNAIKSGLADVVGKPEELPAKILEYLRHIKLIDQVKPELESHDVLEKIMIMLREHNGNDFSSYKKNTLYRRVERRMSLHHIESISQYNSYLQDNPKEIDLLFKELLIGVTNFFRDPAVWEYLKTEVFPALFANHPSGKVFRAWVPACSTGEEAYSLAIVFKEALEAVRPHKRFSLQIFATDLDRDAIDRAREGFYPANIASDVPAEWLNRYFNLEENGYCISKEIRSMVVFATQNLIMDPPFTKLDFLSCRNLLIYLGPELQKKLLPLFHYALSKQGILLLGNAETIGNYTHLFTPIEPRARLYRSIEYPLPMAEVSFPVKHFPSSTDNAEAQKTNSMQMNVQTLTEQLILQNFAPAAVLVNAEGDILYVSGRTGKYLEPAAGKANWNIHAMAREGLRESLIGAVARTLRQQKPVQLEGLKLINNGRTEIVNITLQAIEKPEPLRGRVMVVFTDVISSSRRKAAHATDEANESMRAELQQLYEELQGTREEMQISQEELKSANEELQSTNEELQSTNEELTTSKEELQSLNEELQTVNAELQSKVDVLSWINNDMNNLLNSIEVATIFLDNSLYIRRFTPHSTHLFKLIPTDTGRPLSDIVTDLNYPQLLHDSQEVLRTLVYVEKQINTFDGRCFKVRIRPYRTQENVIDGLVLTFLDISEYKAT